jgi:molybdopterin converting factor small subunit
MTALEEQIAMADRMKAPQPEVLIRLPRALLDLFPEAGHEVTLPAATIAEMIAALDARWPGMRDRLCDSTPRIRRHLNIFVEGRRATLETQLKPGTKIYVMTAVSGG